MIKQLQLILLIVLMLLTKVNYAQINLSADRDSYNPFEKIMVSFSNGPGNPADWIGIYKFGDVPGTVESILWNYVNGTQSPTDSIREGTLIFPTGLDSEGDYWVGMFENDSYNLLVADTFKVMDDGLPRVRTNKFEYDIGDSITVFFNNGPNNPTDWIGIYKVGDVPGVQYSTLWFYVDGTQNSSVGITDGSVTFNEGLAEVGSWWAGFFENDGYTLLDSMGFTVSNLSDSIAPAAPEVSVLTNSYSNLVIWTDVPDEFNETYYVYASVNPITDVDADNVELIKTGIASDTQVFVHVLQSANVDRVRNYYYAVTCRDYAGNFGPAGTYGPVTNTAKGVPTISITSPTPFVADGDLSEWDGITPFVMQSALGTANVPASYTVDGDLDLSAEVKVAVDNDYLYVMFDVTDDAYYHPQSLASWERDEPDLYIGLYNLTKSHTSYGTGATADYQLRFDEDRIRIDAATDCDSLLFIGENYFHEGGAFPGGYVIEARIPLIDLATKRNSGQTSNDTINWQIGDRIPFTVGINDNDNGTFREGMIFYSSQPTEQAWWDVSSWTYTWISDELTSVEDNTAPIYAYDLKQNYPNPFNPQTKIKYSIAKPGLVSLKVFDILGKQVAELVNGYQSAGNYIIDFQSSNLKLSSGVYFYELQAGDFVSVNKMLLLK